MDRDGDGYITWEEFIAAATDKIALLNDSNLKAAFAVLDEDGNGRITTKELKGKFQADPNDNDDKMWEEIIRQIDTDNCNAITWGEFKAYMSRAMKNSAGKLHDHKNK